LLGTLQTMGTPNGIRPFLFTHTLSLDDMYCSTRVVSIFCPGPLPYSRNSRNMLFYIYTNRTLPWGKCHFSANIAEVVRVIYALSGHFYKYTTQSVTVECQLKLSQHISHERTWGHHLQYDRFRTTFNKNWRDVTGNNFTDHVTNTCSDNSRLRDFIVVWELRRPLRVLPTFEDRDLTYSWISEISGHNCNSETRAKLKISMLFSNSAASK
jgi:hypothetical protein